MECLASFCESLDSRAQPLTTRPNLVLASQVRRHQKNQIEKNANVKKSSSKSQKTGEEKKPANEEDTERTSQMMSAKLSKTVNLTAVSMALIKMRRRRRIVHSGASTPNKGVGSPGKFVTSRENVAQCLLSI